MGKKGEEILIGLGMMPKKKKPMEHAEPDGDEVPDADMTDDDGDEDAPEGAVVAAEDFCREAGIDEEKAPAIAKLIRQIVSM